MHYLSSPKQVGLFITFEGIEGCGKTTQIKLLTPWLKERGYAVCVTYEPGDTFLGQEIRKILLSPNFSPAKETELLLYLADRAEHVEKVIHPALKENKIVLCDRYHDSTLAYQGYGRGLELAWVNNLFKQLKWPKPDLTFLLDCPVEVGLRRLKHRALDRIEGEKKAFHQRVREGFLSLAQREPERIKVIDATQPIEDIQIQIREWIRQYGL
jgi:dTMP kinase